jgi:hypothetical protein
MSKLIPYIETVEDARLRPGVFPVSGPRPIVQRTPDSLNERIYCVSCHHPGAYVTIGITNVIYLCDQGSACGCNCSAKGELALPRLDL